MAGIAHKNLTDPQLHEPKGVSTAPLNTACFSDGNGHSIWLPLTVAFLKYDRPILKEMTEPVVTPTQALDILGMSGEPLNNLSDAGSFMGVNQNTKSVAARLNSLVQEVAQLQEETKALRQANNTLLQALIRVGFINGEEY